MVKCVASGFSVRSGLKAFKATALRFDNPITLTSTSVLLTALGGHVPVGEVVGVARERVVVPVDEEGIVVPG